MSPRGEEYLEHLLRARAAEVARTQPAPVDPYLDRPEEPYRHVGAHARGVTHDGAA